MQQRLLQLALITLLAPCLESAPAAASESTVTVESRGNTYAVRAEAVVDADAAGAWQVLTDYNRLAEFVPDMRVSRIISAPGEPLLLEQSGEAGFLIFRFSIDVVLEVEETPQTRLGFRARRGNMRHMQGEWRIESSAQGIRLLYTADMEPAFWVPPVIGPAILRRDIASHFDAVAGEIRRRRSAATAPPLPNSVQ